MNINKIEIYESNLAKEVEDIIQHGLSNIDKNEAYRLILSVIDLTTLEGTDTNKKVTELCHKAYSFNHIKPNLPNVAAVCVYPNFIPLVKQKLKNKDIKLAAVAGAFPGGQSPLEIRLSEVRYAVVNGADEIDMVISRGKYLEGDYDYIYNEVKEIKKVCGEKHLKVILETGELKTASNIRHASDIAIAAGADFIKTSTGKVNPAATPEAFYIMLKAIKDHYLKTNKMVGIKPAGGIRDAETALKYFILLKEVLGEKWLNPEYFRIGASSLANNIVEKL